MAITKQITVAELDELLIVLQDDNFVPGPQDRELLSFLVQVVRHGMIDPEANDVFDLETIEKLIEQDAGQ
jgi:hypothetical protein